MPELGVLATQIQTVASRPFSLYVNSEDVIAPIGSLNRGVPLDSISITEAGANSPGSMTFRIDDPVKGFSLAPAADVVLWDRVQNVPLFGGYLLTRSLQPDFGQQGRSMDCVCTDYSPLLDLRLVPSFATPAGISDQAAIAALVGNFGGELIASSATVSIVDSSLPALSFIGLTLRQAIEKVAAAADPNAVYWLDSLKRLWYTNASSLTAPYVLSDAPTAGQRAPQNLTAETEDRVVNAVYVRGGNNAGSGWVRDAASIALVRREYQDYLDEPDSDTAAKRNSYGAAFLGRSGSVVRGSFDIDNADGWHPGQLVTITNAALGISGNVYQIAAVTSTFLGGGGARQYHVEFGALSKSLSRLLGRLR